MRSTPWLKPLALALLAAAAATAAAAPADPVPARLAGAWRITRVLPSRNAGACWTNAQAQSLVGSRIVYRNGEIRWQGGAVPVAGVLTRTITPADFRRETAPMGEAPAFADLGIRSPRVLEVDLQHEDADITGATTEVPGDAVLLAAPNRIVLTACGVYFEATRPSPRH